MSLVLNNRAQNCWVGKRIKGCYDQCNDICFYWIFNKLKKVTCINNLDLHISINRLLVTVTKQLNPLRQNEKQLKKYEK